MTKIPLSAGTLRKLKREASGSSFAYRQLCRESVSRRWLKSLGIPSLCNPKSPPAEYSTATSRYGIMLEDGSRFMVCREADAVVSFDSVAAAKCFAVLAVSLEEDCSSGEPAGFVLLSEMEPGIHRFDFTGVGHGTPASFLRLVGPGGHCFRRLLKMCIRLLILGEPDAPVRGTENIMAFQPAERREV